MAKVTGPLFSLSATGQIAKTLVYMSWKGIADVRKYVIPANPKTADQITQRGFVTWAVAKWHSTPFNALDVAAWNLYASISGSVMSGFNKFVKCCIARKLLLTAFSPIWAMVISPITATTIDITAAGTDGDTMDLFWGLTPTSMTNEEVVTNTAGVLTAQLATLVANTTYYFYLCDSTVPAAARTGIYKTKTIAA